MHLGTIARTRTNLLLGESTETVGDMAQPNADLRIRWLGVAARLYFGILV